MILEAFAKINWSLDITGEREDGYHLMDMLMQPVSLADEIHLKPARDLSISTAGHPAVRANEKNLAYRAAVLLKSETRCPEGAAIHIQKSIPVGAGMGGGSTDAAAVLIGLNRLWHTGLSDSKLEELALGLGADVPFFIRGGLTRTRGIGEKLESLDCRSNYWLVVIQPCPGLSTMQVFSLWRNTPELKRPDTERAMQALETGDAASLCVSICNVLQPVSTHLRPEIESACEALLASGAMAAEMTGSGSAVFGVFRSGSAAERAFAGLSRQYHTIYLCHTQHDSIRVTEEQDL